MFDLEKIKKTLIFIVIFLLIIVFFLGVMASETDQNDSKIYNHAGEINRSIDYEVRKPIHIENNSGFSRMAKKEGWPGNGSSDNSYIIEGYKIDGGNKKHCIYISNTTVHFIIRNNLLYNSSKLSDEYICSGIKIKDVENGVIDNNTFSDNQGSILLVTNNKHNHITDNKILDSDLGLFIYGSRGNTAHDNIFSGNRNGIVIARSSNSSIKRNDIVNSTVGIKTSHSKYYVIESNQIRETDYGIRLQDSFFEDETLKQIDQLFYNDMENNLIRKNSINGGNIGISLYRSNKNIISDNSIFDNKYGLIFKKSYNNRISKNFISSHSRYGVYIKDSKKNTFLDNDFKENKKPVYDDSQNNWVQGYPGENMNLIIIISIVIGVCTWMGAITIYLNKSGSDGEKEYNISEFLRREFLKYPLIRKKVQTKIDKKRLKENLSKSFSNEKMLEDHKKFSIEKGVFSSDKGSLIKSIINKFLNIKYEWILKKVEETKQLKFTVYLNGKIKYVVLLLVPYILYSFLNMFYLLFKENMPLTDTLVYRYTIIFLLVLIPLVGPSVFLDRKNRGHLKDILNQDYLIINENTNNLFHEITGLILMGILCGIIYKWIVGKYPQNTLIISFLLLVLLILILFNIFEEYFIENFESVRSDIVMYCSILYALMIVPFLIYKMNIFDTYGIEQFQYSIVYTQDTYDPTLMIKSLSLMWIIIIFCIFIFNRFIVPKLDHSASRNYKKLPFMSKKSETIKSIFYLSFVLLIYGVFMFIILHTLIFYFKPNIYVMGFLITPFMMIQLAYLYPSIKKFIEMRGIEIIETPTSDKMRRIIKLIDKIKEEENLEELKLIFLETDEFKLESTYNIIKRRSEIHISDKYVKYLDYECIKPIIYHEIYHVKNDVRLLTFLNILSDFILLGRGGVTALIDMPGREYEADRCAAEKTSPEMIKKAIKNRKEARIDYLFDKYDKLPEEKDEKFSMKKFFTEVYDIFTRSKVTAYVHPTEEERLEHINTL